MKMIICRYRTNVGHTQTRRLQPEASMSVFKHK